jgi:hypothetical protein
MDYEFDVVIHMEDAGKRGIVTKTRCSALANEVLEYPGSDLALTLKEWLAGVDPETLPMSKAQFIEVCDHNYGATKQHIAAALKEAGEEFTPAEAPSLLLLVDNYMEQFPPEGEMEGMPEKVS